METEHPAGRLRRALAWVFVSRTTGRVTLVQFPNVALWLFVAGALAVRLLPDHGPAHVAASVVRDVALLWWAADEVLRGVNPFRRALGLVVLAFTVGGLVAG